jgi:hypothetical protein
MIQELIPLLKRVLYKKVTNAAGTFARSISSFSDFSVAFFRTNTKVRDANPLRWVVYQTSTRTKRGGRSWQAVEGGASAKV